jgi:hypothetical protein
MSGEIKRNKTFYVLDDGTVSTHYSFQITNEGMEVIVYDRNSPTGLSELDLSKVVDIITEETKDYDERLKQFIGFLHNVSKDNNTLYKFTFHVWNEEKNAITEMLDEDVCLSDDLRMHIDNLKSYDGVDLPALLYFEEKFINQEFIWWKYSQEWLDSLSTNPEM